MTFILLDAIVIPAAIPSDAAEQAAFAQLVTTVVANPKAKPGTYCHHGLPLVHHAVRTGNVAALHLLAQHGVSLTKPFRDTVDGTPARHTLTPLEEALLRHDIGMVTALFDAGLDRKILDQHDMDKPPYRALLRAPTEPTIGLVDALLEQVSHLSPGKEDELAGAMVTGFVRWKLSYHALTDHLLNRIRSTTARQRVAADALNVMTGSLPRNLFPSYHRFVPIFLNAGAFVDGHGDEGVHGHVMCELLIRMKPSANRERTLDLMLAHKPNLHAEVSLSSYRGGWMTPFVLAIRSGDRALIERFIAAGALTDGRFETVLEQIALNPGCLTGLDEKGRHAFAHVQQRIVEEEARVLAAAVEEALAAQATPASVPARARARL
ncbi:hypothetical protein SAMN05216466_106156 [Paraburkholderia phenazinium]|uniref:Uncharacterized protein n=1 Tax=Paraburkholderia phenazinium TaxID=60549 RepID=A0A1G7YEI7_9BURK|nr:hypothetical protein [Paraburkholderia phenazinium]SDG94968.1 hypothetical protein SAMN05216466_106156 [Paraburkholderia phenazinium]